MRGYTRRTVFFLVATFVCFPMRLSASEEPVEVEIHYMPPGEKVWLPETNAWGRGFDREGYKLLLQIDNNLYVARAQLKLGHDLQLHWYGLLEEKDKVINTLKDDKEILATRSVRIEKKWGQCEEDRAAEAGGPLWPYIIAIVGGSVGVAGVVWGAVAQATAK